MLTVAQVALKLGICKMSVYRLIHAGKIPATRVGKLYRIDERDFRAYLRKARIGANTSGRADGSQA